LGTQHTHELQPSLLTADRAPGEDIVVMTSGAFTAAYILLADIFAAASGHRFITAATKMGVGSASIPSRLAAGEAVDIVIVASHALEQLSADGRIVRGSRVDLARSNIAMAVPRGASWPDISSVEALKRTLSSAKSVACSRSVSGGYLVEELFPSLGLANEMRGKVRMVEGESVGAVLARGDAEMGFQQVSELRTVPGVEIVGLLPGETQRVTVFSAGIAMTSQHSDAARAFLVFLSSPTARKAIEETGLEPLNP
jgi:molybdate transport system substrate-binding protein